MARPAGFAGWMSGAIMLVCAVIVLASLLDRAGVPRIPIISLVIFGMTFRALWDRQTSRWRRVAVGSNTAYAFLAIIYLVGLVVLRDHPEFPVTNFTREIILAPLAIAAAGLNVWTLVRIQSAESEAESARAAGDADG